LIDAKHIIDRFDKNGDGVIDLNEFVREFRHKSKAIYLESALEGKKI
jgi:Ca2+-binding EF-hand superfamily protein